MSSPTKPAARGHMDLDDILVQLGQFGRYHVIIYCLISLPIFFCAMFALNYVFTTMTVDHRCFVPECDQDRSTYEPDWLYRAVPHEKHRDDERPSRCLRYQIWEMNMTQETTCPAEWFIDVTAQCDQWVFRGPEVTIATEWNITCDDTWKLTLVGTINNVAQFIGFPFVGYIADRLGRRTTLVGVIMASSIMGISKSFTNNYAAFVVFEFLDPLFSCGIYSCGFILGMELVGPRKRVLAGAVISSFYAIGETILGLLAYWLRSWRDIVRIVYFPSLLFLSYYWLVPESVRWLISKGRLNEAREILRKAAKINGVELDEKLLYNAGKTAEEEPLSITSDSKLETQPQETLIDIWNSRELLLRVVNCSFCWLVNNFVYFGLALNSVSVGGNAYFNFILVALIELPAFCATYLVMDRWGRKLSMVASLSLTGVSCIGFMFVPEDLEWARLALFMTGKFAITVSFTVIYVYTAEMFPTQLRSSLLGVCGMFGRLGSVVAPQTPLLSRHMESLPLLLFGGLALLAAALSLLFPETLNVKLPDTIAEAEDIGKKRRRSVV